MKTGDTDMQHLNEDELVLHYYGEMDAAEEERTVTHLAGCRSCHTSYTRLQRVLALVDTVPAPELTDAFERTTWARLEPALAAPRHAALAWFLSPPRLAWAAAIVLLVGGAFVAGRMTHGGASQPGQQAGASAAQVRERILLVDLGDHLDRSQMVLVELVSAGSDDDLAGERARAEQLVSANRLYRQSAADAGDAGVADLLDELERVLVDVAAGPQRASSQELDEIRRRIESRGLLFKVRVVSSEIKDRQRELEKDQTAS